MIQYIIAFRDSRGLEREAIREAEAENISRAFDLINQAVTLTPERPSCYNNRAQIHRLNLDVKSALKDLDKALFIKYDKIIFFNMRKKITRVLNF